MSTKKPKFKGHFRAGKKVVPVIFYAPPDVHRRIKAKCKKNGVTQDAYLNLLAARSLGGATKPKKKPAPRKEPITEGAHAMSEAAAS